MDIEEIFLKIGTSQFEKEKQDNIVVEDIEFNDIRSTGLMGNIDKKRTMLAAFKRNALSTNILYPIYRKI